MNVFNPYLLRELILLLPCQLALQVEKQSVQKKGSKESTFQQVGFLSENAVSAVDTKRIVAESKHRKRLATIVQNMMHLSAKNVLNVFIPRAT